MSYLFFDTETTGLPEWTKPSNHPDQPHITQIAAALVDDNRHARSVLCTYIQPNGWTVPDTGAGAP